MKKNICGVLRHGLIVVTILLCLFAVCATPAAAVDVYEEASNYDMLSTHIRIANENPSNSYRIAITDSFPMGYPDTDDHGALTISGNVTLTTNSTHPHTLNLLYPVTMFTIANGGKLTICGNNSKELTLQGLSTNTNSLIYITGGTFTMKTDSTLTGNKAEYGGAVYVFDGEFVMEGGTITKNTAKIGGGVEVQSAMQFTMTGGEITENTATERGGGVDVTKGFFTMTGGKITGNSAPNMGGVYVSQAVFKIGGYVIIEDNTGGNVFLADSAMIQIPEGLDSGSSIGVASQNQNPDSPAVFANEGELEPALPCFFADTFGYTITYDADENDLLLAPPAKAIEKPTTSSVWIAAPVNSKLGSGVLDNPNGGKINFPEGFPFDSVTINQAGEVTQSSPSSVESEFPVSDTRQILASADITANPALPSDGAARIEFSVPIEKIPEGYTVGVYHGVVKGQEESAAQDAYDAASKAWEASNEVYYIIEECNSGLNDPSFNIEEIYYALQEAIQKAKEAIEAAREAADAAMHAGDEEAYRAAFDAAYGSELTVGMGESLMEMIVEKLGYVPQGRTDVYAWRAEKVIETGRSDGLIHYAVEVNSLSPFIIVVEQGGAEPVKEYDADVVPPLDLEPAATPTESTAPLLGVLAGLGAVVCLRRR